RARAAERPSTGTGRAGARAMVAATGRRLAANPVLMGQSAPLPAGGDDVAPPGPAGPARRCGRAGRPARRGPRGLPAVAAPRHGPGEESRLTLQRASGT